MYQTSNRTALRGMNTVNVSFFNVPRQVKGNPPRLRLTLLPILRTSVCLEVQQESQSPQTLSAALSLGLRPSQHRQTQTPVFPQLGLYSVASVGGL